jgi:hypothetical protein
MLDFFRKHAENAGTFKAHLVNGRVNHNGLGELMKEKASELACPVFINYRRFFFHPSPALNIKS